MKVASVIIYRERAYIPTDAQIKEGPYIAIEPVHCVHLDVAQLSDEIQKAYQNGNPSAETVDWEEYQKRDPILKATKARTWKQLAREGASYGISWHEKEVVLAMSKVDGRGRFVDDRLKEQRFPSDVSMETLAATILADWQTRKS